LFFVIFNIFWLICVAITATFFSFLQLYCVLFFIFCYHFSSQLVRIFRVNEDDKSMPLRDEKTGFCVPADFGEVGLYVCVFVFIFSVCSFQERFISRIL